MEKVKYIFTLLFTYLSYMLGGFDRALQILLICICFDYITRLIAGYILGNLSSKDGFKGILKKVLYLIVVSVGFYIDEVTKSNGALRSMVIYYFITNECLSILENIADCGIKLPVGLTQKLGKGEIKND